MTAQIHDVVLFGGAECAILKVKGRGLFTPGQARLHTEMLSTACRRGYLCKYHVHDDRLFLEELQLALNERGRTKLLNGTVVLFGMTPASSAAEHLPYIDNKLSYANIGELIPFNGSLILGRPGPSSNARPNQWNCETFFKLTFVDGALQQVVDDTSAMKRRLRTSEVLLTAYSVLSLAALAACIIYWLFW